MWSAGKVHKQNLLIISSVVEAATVHWHLKELDWPRYISEMIFFPTLSPKTEAVFNYIKMGRSNQLFCLSNKAENTLSTHRSSFLSQKIQTTPPGGCSTGPVAHNTSDIRIGGCLAFNDHAMMELTLLRDIWQTNNKITMLNFKKAEFHLFGGS